MVDLADILPSTETVNIRGQDYEVPGIDVGDIVPLIRRFPALTEAGFDAAGILAQPREAVGAILAAGLGKLGDADVERGLANLKLGEKAALAAAIVRQTAPDGVGPFVDLVVAVAGATGGGREQSKSLPSPGKPRSAKLSQVQ